MYPPAAVVVHSEWVCGTVCRRSPLPWRWWVGCICGWLTRSRRSTNSCISTVWLKTFTLLKFSYFFTTENFKQKFYTPFTCSYLYVQLPTFIKLSLTLTKLASSNFFTFYLKCWKSHITATVWPIATKLACPCKAYLWSAWLSKISVSKIRETDPSRHLQNWNIAISHDDAEWVSQAKWQRLVIPLQRYGDFSRFSSEM